MFQYGSIYKIKLASDIKLSILKLYVNPYTIITFLFVNTFTQSRSLCSNVIWVKHCSFYEFLKTLHFSLVEQRYALRMRVSSIHPTQGK